MDKETINQILTRAVNAPSGSNSQPWHFGHREGELMIFAEPEKDHPILNYHHRGTWIAHGALIENIKIAAAALGWHSTIIIFPDPSQTNLTARIQFHKAAPSDEDLSQVMPQRATNRKRYDLKSLHEEERHYLNNSITEVGESGVGIVWIRDKKVITRLGQVAAANEIVTLENRKLHELFFDEIVWTREEETRKKKGLYLETMELKSGEKFGLLLFKKWARMKRLAKLGAARKVAESNAKNYAATPLIGLVVVENNDQSFLSAGRVVERAWLKAERLSLGFHLITGTMFYWQGINLGEVGVLSEEHCKIINEEYAAVVQIAGLKPDDNKYLVTAMLRVGRAARPSGYSTKLPPRIADY